MKLVIGGTISIILSFFGFALFFADFIAILKGTVPVILILAGGLIVYLNKDEAGIGAPETEQETAESPGFDSAATVEAVPAEQEPVVEAPATEPKSGSEPAGKASYVGNESSLVFHRLECKYAASKKCTVTFATREEAIEKGFKPCNVCKP